MQGEEHLPPAAPWLWHRLGPVLTQGTHHWQHESRPHTIGSMNQGHTNHASNRCETAINVHLPIACE
jgi:hypothetical protein